MSRPKEREVSGHCGICPSGCAVTIRMAGDRITHVSPKKRGAGGVSCQRSGHGAEILYSPDRILHPLKRVGARGENRFTTIGWDEALDSVAEGLRAVAARHGPEAACLYTGRGTFERSLWEMLSPAGVRETCAWSLLFPFGSPNTTGAGSNCYVSHAVLAPATTLGVWWADTAPDIEGSNLIVVWGTNPANASPPELMPRLQRARKRGARLIVIDHRRTETARATSAEWVAIHPGTDGALALAMIRVILDEGLQDRDLSERWTVGLPELQAYVAGFSPEQAEQTTGVPADTTRRLARAIAGAGGASLLSYTGLEYTNSATQNIRAVMILWALTGNLDVPGGNLIKAPGTGFCVNQSRRISPPPGLEQGGRDPIGKSRYPLYHHFRKEAQAMELPRAILQNDPYPVRALLVFGASIITGYPDPALWRRAFSALDFLLVVDRFPTEDARYADIILPAATAFEYDSYLVEPDRVLLRRKVIEPVGESRSDWQIVSGIADRLGYGHLYPRSTDEMLRWAFEGTGVSMQDLVAHPEGVPLPSAPAVYRKWESGRLRADGKPGFETPTGKLEIASSLLREHGYEALPVFTPPLEGAISNPALAGRFPLVFNSGARNRAFFCSQHHNIPALVKQRPRPLVWINPADARARGISQGDAVDVVSPRGSARFEAFVTTDITAGAVEADAGGGSPVAAAAWRDCNTNVLTDFENRDPISGFPVYKALLCDVVKVGQRPVRDAPVP